MEGKEKGFKRTLKVFGKILLIGIPTLALVQMAFSGGEFIYTRVNNSGSTYYPGQLQTDLSNNYPFIKLGDNYGFERTSEGTNRFLRE